MSSNDATTAVQVINRLHDCLRQHPDRPFPNGHVRDEDDELRLIERDGYRGRAGGDGDVRVALAEIRLAAGGSPQVTRRLEAVLTDLKTVAPRTGSRHSTASCACSQEASRAPSKTTTTAAPPSSPMP